MIDWLQFAPRERTVRCVECAMEFMVTGEHDEAVGDGLCRPCVEARVRHREFKRMDSLITCPRCGGWGSLSDPGGNPVDPSWTGDRCDVCYGIGLVEQTEEDVLEYLPEP